MTNNDDYIATFAKQLLENVTFTGVHENTKEISDLNQVMQTVLINGKETQFINDLQTVRKRIQAFYSKDYWIGFGGEPKDQILVENLNVIRGTYVFLVEAVEFRENEILLKLKVVERIYDFQTVKYFLLMITFVIWYCLTIFIRVSYKIIRCICLCTYTMTCKIITVVRGWFDSGK